MDRKVVLHMDFRCKNVLTSIDHNLTDMDVVVRERFGKPFQ